MKDRPNPLLEKLDPAAEATTRSLIGGALRTQAIYVVAKLGVADQLALGSCDAATLAARVGADAGMLRRVLRFLVFNGVFSQDENGSFKLNRAAESLQTAHPRSLRPAAIRAGEGLWQVTGHLLHAVQTGRTPHVEVHGMTFFDRVSRQERQHTFGSRMSSSAGGIAEAIARLDCVRSARTIVDVGGGHGALLETLLRAHPHVQGVLFDRPETIDGARAFLGNGVRNPPVLDRCQLVSGDFFSGIPAGADVYVLSWILHDWSDADALRILRSCRDAASAGATILVAEVLLPSQASAGDTRASDDLLADPYSLDLQMLLLTGGRERTAEEYRSLLETAGFVVGATTAVTSRRGVSLIEARVAEPSS